MERVRLTSLSVRLVLVALGLGLLLVTGAPAVAERSGKTVAGETVVAVTLGKPSPLGVRLSRFSALPAGPITFRVTNAGAVKHDFKICSAPVAGTAKNACAGQKTIMLKPGQSATLRVVLKKGRYEYLCSTPGHAAEGMKGLIGVGVKVAAPAGSASPTPPGQSTTPSPTSPPPGGASIASCPRPQATTVDVNLFEYAIVISANTVPCGQVTFNVRNTGKLGFDFAIRGPVNREGRVLDPGQSTSMTVPLSPGTYEYLCVTCIHEWEMDGLLTVSS